MEKRLIRIAKQIVELEKECQLGKNVQENMAKIEIITCDKCKQQIIWKCNGKNTIVKVV